jgi:GNAT superfamily N-acetyltransferase
MGRDDVPEVVRVLCDAFADYPVMRFILPETTGYRERLATLVNLFVMARVLREETLLGVPTPAGLGAAALVSDPAGPESPPAFAALRETVWKTLGPGPRERYEAFGRAWADFPVPEPHLHLNMIGVSSAHRGRGYARPLLEYVQEMSREHPTSQGVSLTTELPRNLALYEHFGYEVRRHVRIAPDLESWAMFRPDDR